MMQQCFEEHLFVHLAIILVALELLFMLSLDFWIKMSCLFPLHILIILPYGQKKPGVLNV